MSKAQYLSTEPLRIILPPFVNVSTGAYIVGTDTASLVILRPDSTLLPSPPVPAFDANVNFWTAEVDPVNFQEGEWLVKASSNDVNALDQFLPLVWGDYVDDIVEARQGILGRWRIIGTQLVLYEDDGVTVFKTYDLKDAGGSPSATQIFERDPV